MKQSLYRQGTDILGEDAHADEGVGRRLVRATVLKTLFGAIGIALAYVFVGRSA